MTFSKYICIPLLFFGVISADGQTIKALERAGDEAMSMQDFHAAIAHYGDILSMKEDRLDIRYKYAIAANSFNAFEIAEKSFSQVASTDIEDDRLRQDLSNVNFWLGDTQKKMGKYDQAIQSFRSFIKSNNSEAPLDQELVEIAVREIDNCEWANEQLFKIDNHYNITHLGDDVNTPYSEFAPIATDGNLFFSTLRYEKQRYTKNRKLSFSKILKSEEGVIKTILLDSYETKDKHIAHTAFNKEVDQVYFTVCGFDQQNVISCKLYRGNLLDEQEWGNIEVLPELINLEGFTSTQPNIGYEGDKTYLYFVSDRAGGKGGQDIWRSQMGKNGTMSEPENLNSINTERDDITPYFHSNSNTLYFSSNGRRNMGGFDVYSAKFTASGAAQAEHFGVPLNSSYNDVYFTLSEDEEMGYISSNRPESKFLVDSLASCCYDVYRIDFENRLQLVANVFDKLNGAPILNSAAQIIELTYDEKSMDSREDSHTYDVAVLRNRKYELTFTSEGYQPASIVVNTVDLDRDVDLIRKVELTPLPIALLATALDAASLAALDEVSYTLSVEEDDRWKRIEALTIDDLAAFNLQLEHNKAYRITATREGYKDTFEDFDTYDMKGGTSKEVSLLLMRMTPSEVLKKGIDEFLPVPLYFDNDKPRALADPSMSKFTYGELNQAYYARKSTFLKVNTTGLKGEARTMAAGAMETFFDNDIQYARQSLDIFCKNMLAYLNLGNTAEIMIQGYASPLADYEYNLNLGRRRTSSIQNHINEWENGALLPFVKDGSLKITFKSFGETAVKPGVSDNPTDTRNSIYSLGASKERRVEIIEVK